MSGVVGYEYELKDTLLDVRDVSMVYGDNVVLRDVSFQIKDIVRPGKTQGQVNALLAPSGTGKTQLFRCIAGLQVPTNGEVFLNRHDCTADGKAVVDDKGQPILKPVTVGSVGVVAQDYPLFNHLSVWDNLMMAAEIKMNKAAATEKVEALLQRFGLSERRTFYPQALSGGQRQRVAIIQQMVCNGKLLLMDEPFSGLDIIMKEEVQNLISDVAASDEWNSVIVTTHDIQSAIAVADTILLLGKERKPNGEIVPGAYIKHTYNLMDLGLTWHPDIASLPAFAELEREIKARFREL
jgi:ABC-type nitrate/sulfonate/bicarbonate transport system ATPase subunit